MNTQSNKLRDLIHCGIFAAITAVLAQIEIPLPLVPISGQTLAVGLAATILGSRKGALSMVCYVLLGTVGLPVFAGATAGVPILLGPTGGYLFSFIIIAYLTGFYLEKTSFTLPQAMIANTIAMFVSLLLGTVWLKYVMGLSWVAAIAAGVTPFIIPGLIKAFLASWIGINVRKRLITANIMQEYKASA
ncbi:biotin transporter BioY [Alkalicoccobacillus porphyridii]|uniref:Biotin transporter n=1 Tax=Alkalicoccobacillus porphyridii TaxID=2597270 RepID=A0A553ZTA0_9BACI|nr:biotin transporter BioY [Alkalicoccobacillus porphyridii]TSB44692.1 biotin transporter BioY [Alkalicoccobacillus porphyridii]